MTENTLVKSTPVTQEYKNPIAVRFFEKLDTSAEECRKNNGKVSDDTIERIIGKPPIIPTTSDTDARLEAMDELAKYSDAYINVETKIKSYTQHS